MRNIVANCVMVGLALLFLYHCFFLFKYSSVTIQEFSQVVLVFDCVMLLAVILLGIVNIVLECRR